MHPAVIQYFSNVFPEHVYDGKTILEVGSREEGSLRQMFTGRAEYVGLDMQPGPHVEVVCRIEDYFPEKQFDFVISAGTLEHCEDWRGAIQGIKRAVKPHGWVILTTVSLPFARHNYPNDYWRFTTQHMSDIFSDFQQVEITTADPTDTFMKAQKPLGWEENKLDHIHPDIVP